MSKAWCPGCQRGNSYDKNGVCLDCGLEIAQPYKYVSGITNKVDEIIEPSYEKGDGLTFNVEIEDEKTNEEAKETKTQGVLKDKRRKPMSAETKAKIKATRAAKKAKKGSA